MQLKSCQIKSESALLETDQGLLQLSPVARNIVRCVYTRAAAPREPSFLIQQAPPLPALLEKAETGTAITLTMGDLRLEVDKSDTRFTWKTASGTLLLQEEGRELTAVDAMRYRPGETMEYHVEKTADGERVSNKRLVAEFDRTVYQGKLKFQFAPEENLYGLGQGEEGLYNCRGRSQFLYQTNMRIPIPFLLSDRGYAILFDCGSGMYFSDDANGSHMWMDSVDQLDYYLIAGESLDQLVAGFRRLTGRAAMLPRWAFGYMQCRETYLTQEELVETVEEYRRRQVPLDCIIQDWRTWQPGLWGEKIVDKARYPDLPGALEKIHAMNAHAMVSVWPNMNPGGKNHREFEERGLLLGDNATYNAFDPEARRLYWEQASRELFSGGFDAWWCDSSEAFCREDWNGEFKREPWQRYLLVTDDQKRHFDATQLSTYCVLHAKAIYDGQRGETEEKRVVNLTRSGYPSQQQYGAILWSGDIPARWNELRVQIAEGVRMCMSGMPYWTVDIGGFFAGGMESWRKKSGDADAAPQWFRCGDYDEGVEDLGYRELYVRWLQFGAFLPVFRSHGTGTPREIWQFGEKGEPFYDAIERFIRLRYRLIPYIYSLAGRTTLEDYTMLRGLAFDFPHDPSVAHRGDSYMFGPAFLVCPVTEPMYYAKGSRPIDCDKRRRCYLPAGADWTDYWSGERFTGGREVMVDAPLDRMPLFVRAGSIIPMTEPVQYADQSVEKPLEIAVYPGADGEFVLYEDAGDGYGYESGQYVRTALRWDDAARTLSISEREGVYPGMPASRVLRIAAHGQDRELVYDGQAALIRF